MTATGASPITCSIVGGGWRTETFLRIARTLPDQLHIRAVLVRDGAKGRRLTQRWGVPTHATIEALLAQDPGAFVVVAVGGDQAGMIAELAGRGLPVLAETPPARTVEGLHHLHARALAERWRIQVAEQYPFHPLVQAQLAVARSGRLGRILQAHVSVAHGYHGVALLRRMLDWGRDPVEVRAQRLDGQVQEGPGRGGLPQAPRLVPETRILATLRDAQGRAGIYDFASSQYAGWIRSNHVQLRGERGELSDTTVRWLGDHRTPLEALLMRRVAGQDVNIFEGTGHLAWTLGDVVLHRATVPGAGLSDDELAMWDCLVGMRRFLTTGEGFYGLAEACHDSALAQAIEQCAVDGQTRRIDGLPWQDVGSG